MQPKQASETQPEASGLQPDPAPDLDPDFVPNPSDQPDPALPAYSDQSQHPGKREQPGQPDYSGQPEYPGQPGDPSRTGDPLQQPQPAPHRDPVKRQRFVIGAIVVGVLVLIGVVIWVLLNLLGTRPQAVVSTPSPTASLGPLPRDTEAKDFQVGDCFADFDPNASKARAVPCDTEHSAQLGAVHTYPADDSFPGTNALKDKGREVCGDVKLNHAAADKYVLLQQNVYPSTTSWDRGDRRVDCFIVVDSGNTIKEDLLNK
ncbi:septum formation family protein [Micrococcaceae bacterium Sec5.1]